MPLTRYQKSHPHQWVFSSAPLDPEDPEDLPLRPGLWVYLEVPSRMAHRYGLKPADYVMNYAVTFPDNELQQHLLAESLELFQAYFKDHPDQDLYAQDSTALVTPGHGHVLPQ